MAAARRLFYFAVVRQITLLFFYFVEIFFQAKPLFVHLCSCFYSDISVMPYFFGYTCNSSLSSGIAENKAILIAIFLKPIIKIIGSSVSGP